MKKTLLATAVALTFAGVAHGQTVVRFTGSSAYRANTHNAILAVFDATPNPVVYGYAGTTLGGANQAIFSGTIGGASVIVKTSFTGSEAGIKAVAASQNVAFIPSGTTGLTTGGTPSLPAGTSQEVPEVTMSDTAQATSAYNGQFQGTNYAALRPTSASQAIVGVVPFKWIVQAGAPANFTSVNSQNIRALYRSLGYLPLSVFTGDTNDQAAHIFGTGRNPDSGTRLVAFADAGVGALSVVNQYQPLKGGAVATTTGGVLDAASYTTLTAAGTVNGSPVGQGNNGYNSGGQLASALGNTSPSNNWFITYVGTNDAPNAINAGGRELIYNGAFLGGNAATDYNTVRVLTEGTYTFWSYERLLYRQSLAGTELSVATAVANRIRTTDAVVRVSSMNVSRTSDGGIISSLLP